MLVAEKNQVKEQEGEKKAAALPPPPVSGGKSMLATIVGIVFVATGFWGMAHWRQELIYVLKGLIPVSLVLGGIVAAIVGIASLKPSEELRKLAEENNAKS